MQCKAITCLKWITKLLLANQLEAERHEDVLGKPKKAVSVSRL